MDIQDLVMMLRAESSDTESVEAKLAAGGVPTDLPPILSAFANRPGGGTILFGLDEKRNFAAHEVFDQKVLKQAMADMARNALDPPVTIDVETVPFEGVDLVVATVIETPPTHKPVKVKRTGLAYLRQYDGTFPLSEQEVQAFVVNRGQPEFDLVPVAASQDDLDPDSLTRFVHEQRASSEVFSRWTDQEIVTHTRILTPEGEPTTAGILAFGVYPQGVLPNSGIQASSWTGPARKASSQLIDSRAMVGPIPLLLDQAVAWVARNTPTAIEARADGHLYDRAMFPLVAVRELVSNALVHRDLSPYAVNTPISMILEPNQLIISNPGGLFGLTVASLGKTDSHLRNPHLAQLLLTIRTPDGRRVIERLGSGIPRATSALEEAGMRPPIFQDTGLRFTARISINRETTAQRTSSKTLKSIHADTVLSALAHNSHTVSELSTATGLTPRQVRYVLGILQESGRVLSRPTPGSKRLTYMTSS